MFHKLTVLGGVLHQHCCCCYSVRQSLALFIQSVTLALWLLRTGSRGLMAETSFLVVSQIWVWPDTRLKSDILTSSVWEMKWQQQSVFCFTMGPHTLINHMSCCPQSIHSCQFILLVGLKTMSHLIFFLMWMCRRCCHNLHGVKKVKQSHGCHQNIWHFPWIHPIVTNELHAH